MRFFVLPKLNILIHQNFLILIMIKTIYIFLLEYDYCLLIIFNFFSIFCIKKCDFILYIILTIVV